MKRQEIEALKQVLTFAPPGQVDIRGLLITLATEICEIQEKIAPAPEPINPPPEDTL